MTKSDKPAQPPRRPISDGVVNRGHQPISQGLLLSSHLPTHQIKAPVGRRMTEAGAFANTQPVLSPSLDVAPIKRAKP